MTELWASLKQRKLVQWALAYVAGAFALLQGIDIIAQQFGWPESVQRGITLALVLGFGGGFLWWLGDRSSAPGMNPAAATGPTIAVSSVAPAPLPPVASVPIPQKSVAVLPFANDSGDKGERFFSDGLSEDLITALAQVPGLKVINRNSSFRFRNSKDSVAVIAAKLRVAHLLDGGVRRLGDQVRIRAELVNASDGATLWSHQYDRPYKDLFKLQDDITRAVAKALKAKLLGHVAQSDRPPSGKLAAYEAYLKGNAQPQTQAGARRAIALYTEAARIDPGYARSYAASALRWEDLGLVYASTGGELRDAIDKARTAIDTALRLDPDLIAGHYARALLLLAADQDWQGARDEANAMADLAPDAPASLSLKASVALVMGQLRQAETLEREAITLDPLNARRYRDLAYALRGQGRLDAAVAAWRKAIELEPGRAPLHAMLAVDELLRGDRSAAAAAAKVVPPGFWHEFAHAAVLQTDSDRAAADAALQDMTHKYADTAAYQIAELYALRKDPDGMFQWLDRAWSNRDAGIQFLLSDPTVLRYKADPRFAAYCRKVGLPVPAMEVRG